MNFSREDYDLLQQIYDRLTKMQAESQELRVILKQERERIELQQTQTTKFEPRKMENPDSRVEHKVRNDRSAWVTEKKVYDSEAEDYHYALPGNFVEQLVCEPSQKYSCDSGTGVSKHPCSRQSQFLKWISVKQQFHRARFKRGGDKVNLVKEKKHTKAWRPLINQHNHMAWKKKLTKYIPRLDLVQALKSYGMFCSASIRDRVVKMKARRTYYKRRRSMGDTCRKRGFHRVGYGLQSQDHVDLLNHMVVKVEKESLDQKIFAKAVRESELEDSYVENDGWRDLESSGGVDHGVKSQSKMENLYVAEELKDSLFSRCPNEELKKQTKLDIVQSLEVRKILWNWLEKGYRRSIVLRFMQRLKLPFSSGLANHVWKPGGISTEQEELKRMGKCLKVNRMISLMEKLHKKESQWVIKLMFCYHDDKVQMLLCLKVFYSGLEYKQQLMLVDNQGLEMQWRSWLKEWGDSDSYGSCGDLEWISRYGYNESVGETRAIGEPHWLIFEENAEGEILHHEDADSKRSEYTFCSLLESIFTTVYRECKPYIRKWVVKLIIKRDDEKYMKLEIVFENETSERVKKELSMMNYPKEKGLKVYGVNSGHNLTCDISSSRTRSNSTLKQMDVCYKQPDGGHTPMERVELQEELPLLVLGLRRNIRTLQGQLTLGLDDLGNIETTLMTSELANEFISFIENAGIEFQGKKLLVSYGRSFRGNWKSLELKFMGVKNMCGWVYDKGKMKLRNYVEGNHKEKIDQTRNGINELWQKNSASRGEKLKRRLQPELDGVAKETTNQLGDSSEQEQMIIEDLTLIKSIGALKEELEHYEYAVNKIRCAKFIILHFANHLTRILLYEVFQLLRPPELLCNKVGLWLWRMKSGRCVNAKGMAAIVPFHLEDKVALHGGSIVKTQNRISGLTLV